MSKLLRVSILNAKNVIRSKEVLFSIFVAFVYSMLWIFLVHPKFYILKDFTWEFSRFLYVVILYMTVSILRNDIRDNTVKNVFTGVFSRTEIMISKAISLIVLGIFISIIVEINSLLTSILLYKKIGITAFLNSNHLQLFITYIVVVFSMGSLMILIVSIIFSEKKSILFVILLLSAVNFYGCLFLNPEVSKDYTVFTKTPFYNTTSLTAGMFNIEGILINIAWGITFYILATLIINKREIK